MEPVSDVGQDAVAAEPNAPNPPPQSNAYSNVSAGAASCRLVRLIVNEEPAKILGQAAILSRLAVSA